MPRFVDTNVLLYAVSQDPDERQKFTQANEILTDRNLVLSTQVLQEFYVQATRPTRRHRLTHLQAGAVIGTLMTFKIQAITKELVQSAISARERFAISYWDAAIIEAARTTGCNTVLSEDLGHGRDYDGVLVENPFASLPA